MHRAVVEVLPNERDRWVAVIDAPRGPFSTEAPTPEQVEHEVRESVASALGWAEVQLDFVDDLGDSWSPEQSAAQASRLLAP